MSGTESARFLLVVATTVLALASRAHADNSPVPVPAGGADPPRSADVAAAAQALFIQGRHLAAEGRYAEACPKLAQSQGVAPGPGTLLNLADCYEKSGRLASAWIAFHEAAASAQRTGRTLWAQQARERADTLESRVPTFTVVVDEHVPGLEVRRNGVRIESSTLGLPVPVDPDDYEIDATAPHRRPWSTRIAVDAGKHVELHVPALPAEAAQTSVSAATPGLQTTPIKAAEHTSGATERAVALGVGAAGVVLAGIGAYFGVKAIADNNEAATRCPTSPRCTDARAVSLTNDARREADASSASFIAGGTLLAAGITLFLMAPTAPVRPSVVIGSRGSSLALVGRW